METLSQLAFGSKKTTEDLSGDGVVDFQDTLIATGLLGHNLKKKDLVARDNGIINRSILCTWPLFAMFLLSQPWLSNYLNNMWFAYSAEYDVYSRNGTLQGGYLRPGMCDTDAKYIHCTDGQNFTELALKARGKAKGCGCGQGVLGEGLCPMTSYGYTLSDFVSTEPAIATMLGLGFFPLLGTWENTMIVNKNAKPSPFLGAVHMYSMVFFQVMYICWGICSDCIFPTFHAILTVAFLGGFLVHWVVTAIICWAHWGMNSIESMVTMTVANASIFVISLGAIPRVLLTIDMVLGGGYLPNWNYGIGAYAFWFAEAAGLTLTFGAYPIILLAFCHPKYSSQKPIEYQLWPNKIGEEMEDALADPLSAPLMAVERKLNLR